MVELVRKKRRDVRMWAAFACIFAVATGFAWGTGFLHGWMMSVTLFCVIEGLVAAHQYDNAKAALQPLVNEDDDTFWRREP